MEPLYRTAINYAIGEIKDSLECLAINDSKGAVIHLANASQNIAMAIGYLIRESM